MKRIAIDLAKSVYQVVWIRPNHGQTLLRKRGLSPIKCTVHAPRRVKNGGAFSTRYVQATSLQASERSEHPLRALSARETLTTSGSLRRRGR